MKGKKGIASLLAAALLTGCATHPRRMTAEYVPPATYASYSCAQLTAELARISSRKGALYNTLAATANGDAWQFTIGLFFLWPVWFALEGSDSPDARIYRNLLGREEAINDALIDRCPGTA